MCNMTPVFDLPVLGERRTPGADIRRVRDNAKRDCHLAGQR